MLSAAAGAMAGQQGRLSQRLAAFKQRFGQILGPKQHGYGELGQLEQPLVGHGAGGASDTSDSAYFQQRGVPRPGAQAPPQQYAQQGVHAGSAPGGAAPPHTAMGVPATPVPDQVRRSPCSAEGAWWAEDVLLDSAGVALAYCSSVQASSCAWGARLGLAGCRA